MPSRSPEKTEYPAEWAVPDDGTDLGTEVFRAFGPLGSFIHAGIKKLSLVDQDTGLADFFHEVLLFYVKACSLAVVLFCLV